MILPMKKYSFLLYHKDYDKFIEKLYEIGVAHIVEKQDLTVVNEKLGDKLPLIKRYNTSIKFFRNYANSRKITEFAEPLENVSNEALLKHEEIINDETAIKQRLAAIKKDIEILTPWGDFDFSRIEDLARAGYHINFFTCLQKNFSQDWRNDYNAIVVKDGGLMYFVTITKEQKVSIEADAAKLPNKSLGDLCAEKEELERSLEQINVSLDEFAKKYLRTLEKEAAIVQTDFDFSKVRLDTESIGDDKVKLVECWVPEGKETSLIEVLTNSDILYTSREPKTGEKVPILLKNNKIAKLFEPIGDFYTLPEYGELDLTPFFAPFYMLFFGLCCGDLGYGLVIVIGSIILMKKMPKMKSLMKLALCLGIATMIMGTIGGTLFGIPLADTGWSFLEGVKDYMLDPDKLFMTSLMLGAVQIVFGMCLKVANQFKHKDPGGALSTIGWLTLMVGCLAVFLFSDPKMMPDLPKMIPILPKLYYYVVGGIGVFLIFILNNLKRNIFVNIGAGLWDAYNMLTGVLGDFLSYIRLFALGISGAVMGLVFNDFAMNLSPDIIILKQIVMVIILVIGHGINIFMSALSAFVHPIRLTFVEFYKNAGFTGGGKKYSPFAERN